MFSSAKGEATEGEQLRSSSSCFAREFARSSAQQVAYNQLVIDSIWGPLQILKETISFDAAPFMTLLLESIVVYGYAMFRPSKTERGIPEVADGRLYYVERKRGEWRPRRYRGDSTLEGSRGWHLVILEEPIIELRKTRSGDTQWVTTMVRSCASKACTHSLSLEELMLHRRQRNMFNSQPTVFMAEPPEPKSGDTQASWQSLYGNASAPNQNGSEAWALEPAGQHTFQQMLSTRLARSKMMRDVDEQMITDQIMSGNAVGSIPTLPGGLEPTRSPTKQAHAELILSTGLVATQTRHLDGDQFESANIRDLTFCIYDAYRVPPGKFGMNRNTERMAGNLIISQQPIHVYSRWIDRLIATLNAVLEVLEAPQIRAVPDPSIVQSITQFLKPEAIAKMYAITYGIDEADIDVERLKDTMEEGIDSGGGGHSKKSALDQATSKLTEGNE